MARFVHSQDPLTAEEWRALTATVTAIGNTAVVRRFIATTEPLGAGAQTLLLGSRGVSLSDQGLTSAAPSSAVVPILAKDFVLHWRDVAEARLTKARPSLAKAAAAAFCCARSEDQLALFGNREPEYQGFMNAKGRTRLRGLRWSRAGDAFDNFTRIASLLAREGHHGRLAAVVHPNIYNAMHRVLRGSSLLEIENVAAVLKGGVFRTSLLEPNSGLVISTGRENAELLVSVDTSVAFLGARQMNLPFRVFKAVCLRIMNPDAICTFEPE